MRSKIKTFSGEGGIAPPQSLSHVGRGTPPTAHPLGASILAPTALAQPCPRLRSCVHQWANVTCLRVICASTKYDKLWIFLEAFGITKPSGLTPVSRSLCQHCTSLCSSCHYSVPSTRLGQSASRHSHDAWRKPSSWRLKRCWQTPGRTVIRQTHRPTADPASRPTSELSHITNTVNICCKW